MNKTYHVLKQDKNWGIKKSGCLRISGKFELKTEAIKRAKQLAKPLGLDVYIHREDGRIIKKLKESKWL